MKKRATFKILATAGCLTLASCTSVNNSSKGEKQQIEISMHNLRTDIEELKHDLNTQQMQLGIFEGKLVHIDDIIDSLKIESNEKQKSALEELQYHLSSIEKKLEHFETKQKEILTDLSQLESHANHTTKALGQYKEKVKEFEQTLALHTDIIKEFGQIKQHLPSQDTQKASLSRYKVKAGDSLQRIAKNHNTTIEELKRVNHLRDDLIIVGQELIIPK